ncbi:MAG: radical SAM protein [Deltaproteobacteria bacterium]|nr:radical SAM protein [Deltaproteobacteria bacterium]
MKVLFLTPPPLDSAPPAERIFGCNYGIYHQPNIFILYPATILKGAGHRVRCMDFPSEGRSGHDFETFCKEQDYDVIFFYSVFLSKRTDIRARNLIHDHNPRTKFVFMATEPSASPDDFIDAHSVVIRGEPESRVLPVIEALDKENGLSKVPGISYMIDGQRVHQGGADIIEDLDALPFPDRSLIDSKTYHNPKLSRRPFTTMMASRGCRFRCYYCVPNSLSFAREMEYKREKKAGKPPVRMRSPENIIQEFKELAELGYRSVSFIDDQFVWGSERTSKICRGIKDLGMEWSCLSRADMLQDTAVVQAIGEAGCRYVDMGIESFDQEILDYIGKDCKVGAFYKAIENLKGAGIEPELNILLGSCPLETRETIERTFRETLRLDVDYVLFSVCTPFPCTEFHDRARTEGWMIKPRYEAIDPIKESFISYPHLTKKEIDRIIKRLYVRFYFRPIYILRRLRKLRGFRDFFNKARAAATIFRS